MLFVIAVIFFLVVNLFNSFRDLVSFRKELFNRRLAEISYRRRLYIVNREVYDSVYRNKPYDTLDIEIDREISSGLLIDKKELKKAFKTNKKILYQ